MNPKALVYKILFSLLLLGFTSCTDGSQNKFIIERPAPLNTGKISFTFDDGVGSVFQYALPLFEARSLSAAAYITTNWIDTTGYMSWSQVQALQNRYGWEIGSHSITHSELPTLSDTQIMQELLESKNILTDKGLNVTSFSTPFGAYDNRVLNIASRHYAQHRGFWDRNDLNRFPYNNTVLMVKSMDRYTLNTDVFAYIDQAIQENKWLILVFHEVLPNTLPNYIYTTLPQDLEAILDYAVASGIEIVLPNHVLSFGTFNLLNQSDQTNVWTMDGPNVVMAPTNMGRYPGNTEAFLFAGSTNQVNLNSPKIPIEIGANYRFKSFVDNLQLSSGYVGFVVEKFNNSDELIESDNLGAVNGLSITEFVRDYSIQNESISYIKIRTYLPEGSTGQALTDQYQIYKLGNP